jgi:hypothetical protein
VKLECNINFALYIAETRSIYIGLIEGKYYDHEFFKKSI